MMYMLADDRRAQSEDVSVASDVVCPRRKGPRDNRDMLGIDTET